MNKSVTLMELIIVIIVIGILAVTGMANFTKARTKAYDRKLWAQLRLMYAAQKSARLDTGSYVNCSSSTTQCSTALGILLDPSTGWDYCARANTAGFCASAQHRYGTFSRVSNANDSVSVGNCPTPCW